MNIVEPCCFTKQLNAIMREMHSGSSVFYTNGDVHLQEILRWAIPMTNMGGGVDLSLALTSVSTLLLDAISVLFHQTYYNRDEGRDAPLINSIRLVTRDYSIIPDEYLPMFTNIAETRNLCFQAVTIANARQDKGRFFTLSGNMTQITSPGPHMMLISNTQDVYLQIHPMIETHIRTHKVV